MRKMTEKKACNPYSNPEGICGHCGRKIRYREEYCSRCGNKNTGWIDSYQKNQCGNCHAYMKPRDKFCRICGEKAGEGAFDPYQNLMECIYGPMPVERTHVCKDCGHRWTTCRMLDDEKYCPKCGGIAPVEGAEGSVEEGVWRKQIRLLK